jgi:hypothetical protein
VTEIIHVRTENDLPVNGHFVLGGGDTQEFIAKVKEAFKETPLRVYVLTGERGSVANYAVMEETTPVILRTYKRKIEQLSVLEEDKP